MQSIQVLSDETIDRIAAGEVVERPLNVVKELVENSIDAGATIIHVEIKNGGTELIRVTDNGKGIDSSEVKTAFLRHATSKLRTVDDFDTLLTMGFRGEALSSICAVSKTEMITKVADSLLGTRISIDGGKLADFCEIGAPNGTTIIVRSLFYNTPARKKFLKSLTTEAALVEDMVEKMALSNPQIAFQFTNNGKLKIQTSGNGQLKDCIYKIYGKDIYDRLLEIDFENDIYKLSGYCAKPEYSSSLRNEEICFVNRRFVRSKVLNLAIEEGYKGYMMQHRFPFCVLLLETKPQNVDVNVHPQKLEVRFSNNEIVSKTVSETIKKTLKEPELIPLVHLDNIKEDKPVNVAVYTPSLNTDNVKEVAKENVLVPKYLSTPEIKKPSEYTERKFEAVINLNEEPKRYNESVASKPISYEPFENKVIESLPKEELPKFEQKNLFEEKLISDEPLKEYNIVGQVFDTYWIVTFNDSMYIVDQHAAHEKVNYEKFLSIYENREEVSSQMILPAVNINLSAKAANTLRNNMNIFSQIGFEIDDFGENSFVIRSIPENLFGVTVNELFNDILDELIEKETISNPTVVLEKLASMSCKAAIKGNNKVSFEEMKHLMKELMTLDNPYNCPHGRPVFIQITQKELEKKFKRIV